MRGETFNARLNRKQSAAAHCLQLRSSETGPDFIVDADVGFRVCQLAEQFIDILGRHDVIDRVKVEYAVPIRKRFELLEDLAGIFCSEIHTRAVEPAESAVVLQSPPTAARRLDRQQDIVAVEAAVPALSSRIKIFVEIRNG